ncbi:MULTISPECIES: NAD(P)-dependent oxidoreductase [Halomonadaceae]|uniref:3-beta hydroxysteroid dehydrogenase n=1 Tax=Halomonas campaniensis TaxID=213554 RepID=A0A246RZ07_9GAMM|nr:MULTISPECIES: NAD(P)-dependent oxidoreductase [Halomonas]MBS3667583.1 NAD(P)-dependent oxidoreductase [Halomonas boliviensis]OWV29409.1 3-beta hydroxysteroid dehydrogenase [Halomonas campaniensis]
MKIALIGASGFIGSALLTEALSRGHHVTALVTRPERVALQENITTVKSDVLNTDLLSEQLRGFEAVISAFSGHAQENVYDYYLKGFHSILAATRHASVPRLLLVGGAATLEVAPGNLLLEAPGFPAEYRATAEGAKTALEILRGQTAQAWTFLSPAAEIFPGERTGSFRLGGDTLLTDSEGNSRISVQDYAVAMIDELENPRHTNQRFCVAY